MPAHGFCSGKQSAPVATRESAALNIAAARLTVLANARRFSCDYLFRLRTVDHQYLSNVLYRPRTEAFADFVQKSRSGVPFVAGNLDFDQLVASEPLIKFMHNIFG